MTANAPTRVITADDDPFARHMIKAALQAAGLTVVAEAKNGREAIRRFAPARAQHRGHGRHDAPGLRRHPRDASDPQGAARPARRWYRRRRRARVRAPRSPGGRGRLPLQGGRHRRAAPRAPGRAPRRSGDLARDDAPPHRSLPGDRRRRHRAPADPEPADPPRVGGDRAPAARPGRRTTSRTRSSSPPRRCARTSSVVASSTSTHAPTPSPPRSACGS